MGAGGGWPEDTAHVANATAQKCEQSSAPRRHSAPHLSVRVVGSYAPASMPTTSDMLRSTSQAVAIGKGRVDEVEI